METKEMWTGRVESTTGGDDRAYKLPAFTGGDQNKTALFFVRVEQASSNQVRLALDVEHGPTTELLKPHSQAFAASDPGSAYPSLLGGQASTSLVLGNAIQPVLTCSSNGATQEWAEVRVYRQLKPY